MSYKPVFRRVAVHQQFIKRFIFHHPAIFSWMGRKLVVFDEFHFQASQTFRHVNRSFFYNKPRANYFSWLSSFPSPPSFYDISVNLSGSLFSRHLLLVLRSANRDKAYTILIRLIRFSPKPSDLILRRRRQRSRTCLFKPSVHNLVEGVYLSWRLSRVASQPRYAHALYIAPNLQCAPRCRKIPFSSSYEISSLTYTRYISSRVCRPDSFRKDERVPTWALLRSIKTRTQLLVWAKE